MHRNPLGAALIVLLSVCAQASAADTLAERRARVEQMDAEQKEQLLQNYQRFVRLDEAERERLRRLHQELETAPDQAELRSVLQRYNDWLSDLPANQRAEISSASPEERMKKIEDLLTAQKRQESSRLGPADVEALRTWVHAHHFEVKMRTMRDGGDKLLITEEQVAELRGALSEDGRAKLDEAIAKDREAASHEKQGSNGKHGPNGRKEHESVRRLLWTWTFQTYRRGPMGHPGGGPGGPGGGQFNGRRPSEQELQSFLKNDVSDQERSDLLSLPHDEMQVMLRRLWVTHEFHRNGGPGDDRRSRGSGDKQRDRSQRRPPDGPPPEKAPAEKPVDEKSADEKPTEAVKP